MRMTLTKTTLALATLLAMGSAIMYVTQRQGMDRLRADNAVLRQRVAETAGLQAENQQRADKPLGDAETARLREQQSELLRLRGEVARLRSEARQNVTRRQAANPPTDAGTPVSGQADADPPAFTAAATVSVRSGEAFATGGWRTSPGFRTFLLATPTLGDGSSGGKLITISTCLLKVPEGELPQTLLQSSEDPGQAESRVLSAAEVEILMSKLNSGGGSNVISRPRIATADGEPASLFVGESRPNPDGTLRQVGTKLDISPQIAQDGKTITMGVNLEYMPRGEDAKPPQ